MKPKILVLTCTYCSYAGADMAGVSKIQYPPSAYIVRLICSGREEALFALTALKSGFDGVLFSGCHLPADCHFISGNYKARARVALLKKLLSQLGVEKNRVKLEWISASEGEKFARVISEFTEELEEMKPLPKIVRIRDLGVEEYD
ncbi:MAG: methyl-viologen-reducing hydrogenase subunit delta [Thermoprotei archaeon]|nr:MAG: methyl-viologen-reducing hydrogenase subunit delta [Thermoprotei archaeon]